MESLSDLLFSQFSWAQQQGASGTAMWSVIIRKSGAGEQCTLTVWTHRCVTHECLCSIVSKPFTERTVSQGRGPAFNVWYIDWTCNIMICSQIIRFPCKTILKVVLCGCVILSLLNGEQWTYTTGFMTQGWVMLPPCSHSSCSAERFGKQMFLMNWL